MNAAVWLIYSRRRDMTTSLRFFVSLTEGCWAHTAQTGRPCKQTLACWRRHTSPINFIEPSSSMPACVWNEPYRHHIARDCLPSATKLFPPLLLVSGTISRSTATLSLFLHCRTLAYTWRRIFLPTQLVAFGLESLELRRLQQDLICTYSINQLLSVNNMFTIRTQTFLQSNYCTRQWIRHITGYLYRWRSGEKETCLSLRWQSTGRWQYVTKDFCRAKECYRLPSYSDYEMLTYLWCCCRRLESCLYVSPIHKSAGTKCHAAIKCCRQMTVRIRIKILTNYSHALT